jgi:hypothetical protein
MHQKKKKWRTFGKKKYGNEAEHNREACWMKNQYQQNSSMECM